MIIIIIIIIINLDSSMSFHGILVELAFFDSAAHIFLSKQTLFFKTNKTISCRCSDFLKGKSILYHTSPNQPRYLRANLAMRAQTEL